MCIYWLFIHFTNPINTRNMEHIKNHFNIILPSRHRSSKFPLPKNLHAPLLSPIRATFPANLIILDLMTRKIFDEWRRKAPGFVVFSTPLLPRPC